jgi:predicted nucleic acid-binding protein
MTADRIFLDANILFSLAWGSPGLGLLRKWSEKGKCLLFASQYVIEEARRNLIDQEQIQRLESFLSHVQIAPEMDPHIPCPIDLPEKDRPVFMAAISIQANYFLTGDITHFGEYFGKSVSGVKILRPRQHFASRQGQKE